MDPWIWCYAPNVSCRGWRWITKPESVQKSKDIRNGVKEMHRTKVARSRAVHGAKPSKGPGILVGDLVLVHREVRPNKLGAWWIGPYRITWVGQ